jgi:hypothetical protein
MKVASGGSILVMTLVFLLIFVVIMFAWLRFASRQNNAVVGQEQEEQSFHVSEAGVNYVLHILNNGTCTPTELNASDNNNTTPVVQSVVDESPGAGAAIGTYELTFNLLSPTRTGVRAVGYDLNVAKECQLIEATLESFTGILGPSYRVLSWDHKSTISCGTPRPVVNPVC